MGGKRGGTWEKVSFVGKKSNTAGKKMYLPHLGLAEFFCLHKAIFSGLAHPTNQQKWLTKQFKMSRLCQTMKQAKIHLQLTRKILVLQLTGV